MKYPKQEFDTSLKKAVLDYHEWHGDKNVKLIGFFCDPLGHPLLLTRATDENGKKVSVLLEFYYSFSASGEWDIKEYDGRPREDEYYMLCRQMSGCGGVDCDGD